MPHRGGATACPFALYSTMLASVHPRHLAKAPALPLSFTAGRHCHAARSSVSLLALSLRCGERIQLIARGGKVDRRLITVDVGIDTVVGRVKWRRMSGRLTPPG